MKLPEDIIRSIDYLFESHKLFVTALKFSESHRILQNCDHLIESISEEQLVDDVGDSVIKSIRDLDFSAFGSIELFEEVLDFYEDLEMEKLVRGGAGSLKPEA